MTVAVREGGRERGKREKERERGEGGRRGREVQCSEETVSTGKLEECWWISNGCSRNTKTVLRLVP